MVVVVVKEAKVLSSGMVEELEVAHYFSQFDSYYFVFVCYRFQARLVIFLLVVVGIEQFDSNIYHHYTC